MKKFIFTLILSFICTIFLISCSSDDYEYNNYDNVKVTIEYNIYSTKTNYYVVKFIVKTSNISRSDISQIGFYYGTTSSMSKTEYTNSGSTEWYEKVNINKNTKYYYQGWIKTKNNKKIVSEIKTKKF